MCLRDEEEVDGFEEEWERRTVDMCFMEEEESV